MAQGTSAGGHADGLFQTQRRDNWWIGPAVTGSAFLAWVAYLIWATQQGAYYAAGPYRSPFYAPLLFVDPTRPGSAPVDEALIGVVPGWWPTFAAPAIFTAALPGLFRLTCYYYRKFYYRAYFLSPPGCAVGPLPQGQYKGETGLLIFQNLHRYTLYIAIALLPFLYLEAAHGFFWNGSFGIGIGSVLLLVNAVLLTSYTLGCHAWRHLIGGRLDCFSCDGGAKSAHGVWSFSTWFNERHQEFAWASLLWIAATDLFIRLASQGVLPDVNTWSGVTWFTGT
jgi:hypothetical protein